MGEMVTSIRETLEQRRESFDSMLAKQIDFDRFVRIATGQIANNPKLAKCSRTSLLNAISTAGQLGIEPGIMGQGYLVPYGSTCTFIIGYRGLIDLARRSGQIAKIEARLVCENDEFEVQYGTEERFIHKPNIFGERGKTLGVYAEAYYTPTPGTKHQTVQRVFMTRDDVEKVRRGSKGANSGPWRDHWDEMAKKTAVRRLCKMLPLTAEIAEGLQRADDQEYDNRTREVVDPATVDARETNSAEMLLEVDPEPEATPEEHGEGVIVDGVPFPV